MNRPFIIRLISGLINILTCLVCVTIVLYRQDWFGKGDTYAFIFWTIPLAFGIGVGIPLILIGLASRNFLQRSRGGMMSVGSGLKSVLGAVFIALGVLILSGLDKSVETALVDASPAWLTALTTRF